MLSPPPLAKSLSRPRGFVGAAGGCAATVAVACLALVAPGAAPAAKSQPSRSPLLLAAAPDSSVPAAGGSTVISEARIFLTARAPYGQPGATDQVTGACGDTAGVDTLYLCFDPGRDAEHFNGLSAIVYFWPAGRDSVGPHWKFGDGQNFQRLKVTLASAAVPGTERAWDGAATVGYRSTRSAGRLMMIAASPAGQGPTVRAGALYGVARILVPRPTLASGECQRPVCIEWAEASLAFKVGELVQVTRGQRFVTWNSPDGKVCGRMRDYGAPAPWHPKGKP